MLLQAGTNPIIDIQIVDDTGIPVTGLVAASFPAISYVIGGANAAVSVTLSDLALMTTAYTSGGVKELSGGFYRFDLPAAAVASVSTQVRLIGEASGKRLLCPTIDVIAAPATHADITALGSPMQASSYVAPTTPPTVVQIRQEMDANSTKLANCDVLTSTRLAASGYTVPPTVAAIQAGMATHADITALGSPMQASSYVAPTTPPTVVQIRQEMDANSTKLANCDVLTSTRLAASGYTVPPTVAAIQAGMATHADITALGSPMQASSYVAPPSAASIALTTASVLFVDGSANPLKVNSDHSVNGGGSGGGGTVNAFSADALSQLAGLTIAVQLPSNVAANQGTIELVAGDDYLLSINRSFTVTLTGMLPDMTGNSSAAIAFTTAKRVVRVFPVTIVSSNLTSIVIRVELTAAQTNALELGVGTWEPQFSTAAGLKWSVPSPATNPFVLVVDARPS